MGPGVCVMCHSRNRPRRGQVNVHPGFERGGTQMGFFRAERQKTSDDETSECTYVQRRNEVVVGLVARPSSPFLLELVGSDTWIRRK